MMLDTLSTARRLKDAGMAEAQAEAVAETVLLVAQAPTEQFSTKADLDATRADLKARIDATRTDLTAQIDEVRGQVEQVRSELKSELKAEVAGVRAELSNLENRLTLRVVALGVTLAGLLLAAIKLIP